MKKFLILVAVACGVSLALWTSPAHAQRRGGWRDSRSNHYGAYYGDFSNRGYAPNYGYYQNGYYPPGYGYHDVAPNTLYVAPEVYGTYNTDQPAFSSPDQQGIVNANYNTQRQSFYSGSGNQNQARIHVVLPDLNARVYFDDTMTQQKGMDRTFTSPPLDPSKTYDYTVRATWMENGQEVTRSRDVKVQAGREAVVDFRAQSDLRDRPGLKGEEKRGLIQDQRDEKQDRRDEKRDEPSNP